MNQLIITNTAIRQDTDGRYCLNDLHIASGGLEKHKPSNWSRRKETLELAEEVSHFSDMRSGLHIINGGSNRGTYACKELVYAYAMWISPKFHLHVIRTFDQVVQSKAVNDPILPVETRLVVAADNFSAAKRIALDIGLEGNQALLSANRMVKQSIGVDVLELAGTPKLINQAQELSFTPTELATRFNMTAREMNKLLAECGLQHSVEYRKGKKRWELLPEGRAFAVLVDTAKKHSDGAPVTQILWKESVLGELKRLAQRLEAQIPRTIAG